MNNQLLYKSTLILCIFMYIIIILYYNKRLVFKNIKNNSKTFLYRISCNLSIGSIKIHIITDDDIKPHTHPWDFKSLIIFGGYYEFGNNITKYTIAYDTETDSNILFTKSKYGFLSTNKKDANQCHLIKLRRICGIKIPCITIGRYGEHKVLCSLCKELGYCKTRMN